MFERVVGIRPSRPPRRVAKAIRSVKWHGRRPEHGQGNAGADFIARGFDSTEFWESTGIGFIELSGLYTASVDVHIDSLTCPSRWTQNLTYGAAAYRLGDKTLTAKPVVALVCDAMYPHSYGGREFRYQAILPRLAEHVDIHVYTMRWWKGPKVYTENGVTFHAICPLMSMYTKDGRRSIVQGIIFALFCLRLLTRPFDVLDVDQIPYFHVFPLRLIATIRRKPLVATWHEVWGPEAWREYLKWLGWLGWFVEITCIRMPDHIISASTQTTERLHQFLGEEATITTIPNGIDIAAIAEVPASPNKVDIVTVGRLIEHKRVHVLLEVISSLHARGIYATARIIGNGPDREALQNQAKALGIDSAVEFCHDVAEQKDLYSLIKASRVFISLSAREGFGIAVLEAITCGVPVLTTTAPDNLAQYLAARYSSGFVCGTDVAEIVEATADILSQPDATYSPSADSWIEEYGWETMVHRIVNIYRPGLIEPVAPTAISKEEEFV